SVRQPRGRAGTADARRNGGQPPDPARGQASVGRLGDAPPLDGCRSRMPPEEFRRLDALLDVVLGLARRARSGRLLLGRVADRIGGGWIRGRGGEEMVAGLQAAWAGASEPLSERDVDRILRDAWGVRAAEELDDLEPDPVAVTPIAQVHRGLLDGAAVAV